MLVILSISNISPLNVQIVSTPPGGGEGGGVVTYSDVINIGLPIGEGRVRPS